MTEKCIRPKNEREWTVARTAPVQVHPLSFFGPIVSFRKYSRLFLSEKRYLCSLFLKGRNKIRRLRLYENLVLIFGFIFQHFQTFGLTVLALELRMAIKVPGIS